MRSERAGVRAWVVAAIVVVAAARVASGQSTAQTPPKGSAATAVETPAPPKLLADLLRTKVGWRLLDPTTDLVGDYTIAQLVELDRWPPWMEMDFDHDGHDDVAAVAARKGPGGETEFSVVVVHASAPDRAHLVAPFSPQRIFGVAEGVRDATVMPLKCADCDANIWYGWNGKSYEPLLHEVGESIRIGSEPGTRSPLFADPWGDAARSGEVPYCARALIKEVSGEEGKRWYRVDAITPTLPKGWVPSQLVMENADCKE